MTLDANQQTAHEQPHCNMVWFVELHFASMVSRLCSLNINVTWGGYEWVGLGSVGDISPLDERLGVASDSLTFTLAMPQTDWLALAAGAVEEYRDRDAFLYYCPLDSTFKLIGTPVRCWRGTMDIMSSKISGKAGEATGIISLKCETSSNGIRRKNPLRLNAAQHKQKYPLDTSLDRMNRLLTNEFPWLSVKYQRR